MLDYLPFLIFLMLLAAFIQADSVLTIFYMIIGTFVLGLWWNHRAVRHLQVIREFDDHAFLLQEFPVKLIIKNTSILPIIWLELHESLPVNLSAGAKFNQVFSLGSKGSKILDYKLYALKRGYYQIGPTHLTSGDLLGISKPAETSHPANYVTVYPRIVTLQQLGLPSRSPFGTIRHKNPVFEDPSRTFGKRAYQNGDSMRRIDWKASAVVGSLQTKQFEASIAMEVAILLDLDPDDYDIKKRFDASELAIITAASIANWATQKKQAVGLFTNGVDPYLHEHIPQPLAPQTGTLHLMSILETLARIESASTLLFSQMMDQARADLAWGSTLVIITGAYMETLLKQLLQAKRAGFNIVLVLVGPSAKHHEARAHAKHFNFTYYHLLSPMDFDSLQYSGSR